MILLIDNHDSFVFNLARYVNELGYDCWVKRNNEISIDDIENHLKPTHIILSPGPCGPDQAGIGLELVKRLGKKIPFLGVCLGHQIIGQAFGATIVKAREPLHGQSSLLKHDGKGIFSGLPNPLKVGRYHSLVVDAETLPNAFQVQAYSSVGEVMAMHHKLYPLFAVQFHPESILTEHGHPLLHNFLCG